MVTYASLGWVYQLEQPSTGQEAIVTTVKIEKQVNSAGCGQDVVQLLKILGEHTSVSYRGLLNFSKPQRWALISAGGLFLFAVLLVLAVKVFGIERQIFGLIALGCLLLAQISIALFSLLSSYPQL